MKGLFLPDIPLMHCGCAPTLNALPDTFRLCVWNWHKCKHPLWQKDFLTLCNQSDLFLAQEVQLSPACQQAALQSGLHWDAAISFLSPRRKIPTGIAAGCRAPAKQILFDASALEPLLRIPKMTMWLVYPLANGGQLLAVNLHAVNFSGLSSFKYHLRQAARRVHEFEGPVIVAGDFNVWSENRRLEMLVMARALGLQEVPFLPDLRTRYLHRPVDYIFTRGLNVCSSRVQPFYSSDHRPLQALLQII